ncbi:WD40 repeat-like protein [Auriscalpium vulgare]|uniref:WD40 repeat-like protein n=1 Tax=Auriscalpium vulgare TaxID=40419 RepID=A0ACB8S9V1_9AGAM|nr:WD40 repeat-like protein [Auriscalpium vulgare]
MKFTKPSWITHGDTSNKGDAATGPKRVSIFSVHVHPDGSRIATGGLDARIRIWSTKPILNEASENSGRPPKSLCTLAMHTGPVLCVRWAHSGRWLASGSDDAIIMIWDLDPTAKGKVWGSDEVNVEGWKPLKRLPGHESDVTDLAWSPEDRYLASVGLDSQVLIWNGFSLERLCKIDQHQGFVKGVCWDPVGEFLATQSDDRTVKIWRTADWQLEAEVRKPFEDSPGSTFFRRLSWSPDGAHITASNATNNQGFVFIAAVIARNSWTSEISLVGHENTVEVAAYNPHIFLRNPSAPVATANICSVVALGADDRSVSVWQTKSARPLIVAKEVFERQIMDLSWSWDGLCLYAVSSDGTLAAFKFEAEELEGIAPHSAQQQYLQKFGFISSSGQTHQPSTRITPPPSPHPLTQQHAQNGFGASANGHVNGGEVINKLVAKRNTKRRAHAAFGPSTAHTIPSAAIPSATFDSLPASMSRGQSHSHSASPLVGPGMSAILSDPSPFSPLPRRHSGDSNGSMGLGMQVPIDAIDSLGGDVRGKRKSSAMDFVDERPQTKARTLGGDRLREGAPVVKEIPLASGSGVANGQGYLAGDLGVSESASIFKVPPVLTYLNYKAGDGTEEAILEARNAESGDLTEVTYVSGKQTLWLDYLPSPVIMLTATQHFCAVGMLDGTLNIYSTTGRRLMPTLTLDSPASFLYGNKAALIALTSAGILYSWNIKKASANFPPISIRPLFSISPNSSVDGRSITLASVAARPNGSPVLTTTAGIAYSYDPSLCTFIKLSDSWWGEGSDAWTSRSRGSNTQQMASITPVAHVESLISQQNNPPSGMTQRPQWWSTAMTLGHLESKLHAAKVLDSGQEYKQFLLVYAKKIADEGFRGKAEELVKELFGPIYWRPGMAKEDGWTPSILGLTKRELLRDVLGIFARSKTLTKLAMDWQDLLKKASISSED